MLGLLRKDFYNLKKQAGLMLGFLVLYGAVMLLSDNQNASFISAFASLYAMLLPITSLSFDERSGWEKLALSMPVTRRQLVLSKYLLGALLSLIVAVVDALIFIVLPGRDPATSLLTCGAFLCTGLIFLDIILPILFKVGTEKARLIMIMIVLLPVVLALLADRLGFSLPAGALASHGYLLPLGTVLLTLLSILISLAIYRKKEF